MAFLVEMFSHDLSNKFSCSLYTWRDMLALAKEHGWQPIGTSPLDPHDKKWKNADEAIKTNYDPGDWLYQKEFHADDAQALADALEKALQNGNIPSSSARPLLLGSEMSDAELVTANRKLSPELLEDFIKFLHKGKFIFVMDD